MKGWDAWYLALQVCDNICGSSVVVFQGVRQSVESAVLNVFKNFILWIVLMGSAYKVVSGK